MLNIVALETSFTHPLHLSPPSFLHLYTSLCINKLTHLSNQQECMYVHVSGEGESEQMCVCVCVCPLQIILQMSPVPVSHCAELCWQAAWTAVWIERLREREGKRAGCCVVNTAAVRYRDVHVNPFSRQTSNRV